MKKFFNLLVASTIAMCSQAQTNTAGKITGSIKDGGQQKIIDAASVSLLKAKDSGLIKVAITDKEGNFIIENVKDGSYLVLATSVGHSKTYSKVFTISAEQPTVSVGVLQLVPQDKSLAGVTVVSKKPFIERKIDRTIVNVDAAISNAGTTALEVLEKSPGVTVDKDGNVSLKGKAGVTIMIDGKPAYLTGADLTNLLRTMPSGNLDQIEIMTNPSAKYDASGTAGIINIKTKKNKQKGFNGSANTSYGQGFYARNNNSINLNYRNGKFNVFSNFSASFDKNYQDLYILRKFKNSTGSIDRIFEQDALMYRTNENYNGKIGVDFYASKKTTIGFVATGFNASHGQDGLNTTYFYDGVKTLDSIAVAQNNEDGPWKNGSLNFNYRHTFDSTGRELTMDADYVSYRSGKTMDLLNNYYSDNWQRTGGDNLVGDLPTDVNIYTFKADYNQNLKRGIKLETGIKSGYVNTDNTAGYFNMVGGNKVVDLSKTNRFQYKENINAAYVNVSKEIKKWGLQAGLRMENTNNSGNQFGNPLHTDSSFKNSYTGLFPNVFVSYKANDKNQLSFSYGRRIRRPDYEDLNPFLFFIDNYTYEQGNPFLQPSIANTLEASHTYKDFLTTSVNYTHTKALFTEVFEPNGNAIVVTHRNYGSSDNASLSVSAQVPVTKWWMFIPYGELNYSSYKGEFTSGQVNVDATTFTVNMNNQFTFKNGWSAELSGFYRTKGIEAQILIHSLGQLNAGVQKQVLKKKGTIKLNVRDIFKTMTPHGEINIQSTDASFSQQRDSRVVTLSLSYRFGKPLKGVKSRKSGGAGDEQSRVKGAN
ncbi:TonB-dependent receptor domain-containing protein [Ferruginibacter sp. SUN106]|uniref:TonB-dependent receptor domain-containing protein n=1 Tax=Ferruginibacter sp. SUN106 TaxID=2978348 RepID=UPI003D361075